MKWYKEGDQIVLEVTEKPEDGCERCWFLTTPTTACHRMCEAYYRKDNKNVIFIEKEKKSMKEKILSILLYPFMLLDEFLGSDSSTQDEAAKWSK